MSEVSTAPIPQPVLQVTTDKQSIMVNEDGSISESQKSSHEIQNNSMEVTEVAAESPAPAENNLAARTAQAKAADQQRLEDMAIKAARTSATGKLIKSAEPFGFWVDPTVKAEGLRPLDLSVTFNTGWNIGSVDLKKMFTDLGYKNLDEAKSNILEIGRYGKSATLTAKDKQTKRFIFNTLSEISHKYKVNVLEDDDVAVNLSSVPHKMSDKDI